MRQASAKVGAKAAPSKAAPGKPAKGAAEGATGALKDGGTTQNVGGTTGFSSASGGTKVQILLENRIVTPQPLQVVGGPVEGLEKEKKLPTLDEKIEMHGGKDMGMALPSGSIRGINATGKDDQKTDLDEMITKMLKETNTEMLFSIPSQCVALDDTELHGAISAKNKRYEELLHDRKASADKYKGQHQQTLNNPCKTKEILAVPAHCESKGVNATEWDISDTFSIQAIPTHEQIEAQCVQDSEVLVQQCLKKRGCLFNLAAQGSTAAQPGSTQTSMATQTESSATQTEAQSEIVDANLKLPWTLLEDTQLGGDFLSSVLIMEKIVVQNVFHLQHMIYRNYPTLEELARNEEMWQKTIMKGVSGIGASAALGDQKKDGGGAPAEAAAASEGDKKTGPDAEANKIAESKATSKSVMDTTTFFETDDEEMSEYAVEEPELSDLFSFDAPQLTKGLSTTAGEWNHHQRDLLAVSYGDLSTNLDTLGARSDRDATKGLILFWSLKNPSYPERIIRTPSGVSSLSFSKAHPNMIAAGLVDGNVAVWDSRKASSTPVLMSGSSVSTHNDRKHTDCVWEVTWVGQGSGGGNSGGGAQGGAQDLENLMSVSADGKIFQWTMRKGLEQKVLMNLKRVPNTHLGSNAFRSTNDQNFSTSFRKASGLSIDVLDSNSYLVSTDDGFVHRCSTSHNEQYLDSYAGHSGTVYRCRCNPWYPSLFLTCSLDWTMKLWSTKTSLFYNVSGSATATKASDSAAKTEADGGGDGGEAGGESAPASPEQAAKSSAGHSMVQSLTLDSPLVQTFQSTDLTSSVQDITWSPSNSTSFAACMDDGRVEIWDLAKRAHDPLLVHYPKDLRGTERTFVRFASNSPVLVCGDGQGTVSVMRIYRIDIPFLSNQEQIERLLNMIAMNESKK